MILSFKEQFVDKIKQGQKVTTIRKSGRWKEDMKIHFWKGSPRNPKSNPYHFGMGKVESIESIYMRLNVNKLDDEIDIDGLIYYTKSVNYSKGIDEFAQEEGFDNFQELKNWFLTTYKKQISGEGNLYLMNMDLIHFDFEELK